MHINIVSKLIHAKGDCFCKIFLNFKMQPYDFMYLNFTDGAYVIRLIYFFSNCSDKLTSLGLIFLIPNLFKVFLP